MMQTTELSTRRTHVAAGAKYYLNHHLAAQSRRAAFAIVVIIALASGCAGMTGAEDLETPDADPAVAVVSEAQGELNAVGESDAADRGVATSSTATGNAVAPGLTATAEARMPSPPAADGTPEIGAQPPAASDAGKDGTQASSAAQVLTDAKARAESRVGLAGEVGIVVDHRSVALFEQIPEEYLVAARDLRMVYSDRSVGQNINEALDCFTATSWAETPSHCRRDYIDAAWNWKTFSQDDLTAGRVPARILFRPDPVRYDRANWTFDEHSDDWSGLTQDFVERVGPQYVGHEGCALVSVHLSERGRGQRHCGPGRRLLCRQCRHIRRLRFGSVHDTASGQDVLPMDDESRCVR